MTDPVRCHWCGAGTTVASFAMAPSVRDRDGQRYYVECNSDKCGASGPMRSTREQAVASWNFVAREVVR